MPLFITLTLILDNYLTLNWSSSLVLVLFLIKILRLKMVKKLTDAVFSKISKERWKIEKKVLELRIKHMRVFKLWKNEYFDQF